MNRRSFIAALGGSVVLAGCSAMGEKREGGRSTTCEEEASFVITEPTVEQGETAVIEVSAPNTEQIRFNLPGAVPPNGNGDGLEIQFDDAEFAPSPDIVWESKPPVWNWESPQRIEGEIPVATSPDTTPGTYQTTILFTNSDFDETQREQTTISVKPDSEV